MWCFVVKIVRYDGSDFERVLTFPSLYFIMPILVPIQLERNDFFQVEIALKIN